MRFYIKSELEAIDAMAVFDGFQRIPGRKFTYIRDDMMRVSEINEFLYFENLGAMFELEAKIYKGPSWYHYCRLLHLVCKSDRDASVHATARQRATAFYILISTRGHLEWTENWPSVILDAIEVPRIKPPEDFTETMLGMLKFHGMTEEKATEAVKLMTTKESWLT